VAYVEQEGKLFSELQELTLRATAADFDKVKYSAALGPGYGICS
jgi:hypothetical protein